MASIAAARMALPAGRNHAQSFATKLFYGMGSIAFGVKDNGFSVLLLLFYNQALGLDAARAGLAIMIALLVDAVLDPLIGYVSDHLDTRWGRRHPLMYLSAVPVALSYGFLFSPPAGLGPDGLFWYLLGLAVLVRFFIALHEIPSSALVAELSQGYDQRTSYLSFRFFFGWMGGLTMSLLAFSVFLRSDGAVAGQLLPTGYRAYGIAASVIMFAAIMTSALGTHRAIPWLNRPAVREGHGNARSALGEVRTSLSSRPAVAALAAFLLFQLANGLGYGLGTYFYTYVWSLTGPEIAELIVSSYAAAAAALFIAPRLSQAFDKRRSSIAITIAILATLPIPLLLSLVGLFPVHGSPALIPLLVVFLTVTTTLAIVQGILLTSMLADVVEDNEVRTGQRTEGVFFAASTFIQKCASAFAVFGSAAMLKIAGFPTHALPGHVAAATLSRLGQTYVAALFILHTGAIVAVLAYRITRKVHAENLAALAERRERRPAPV